MDRRCQYRSWIADASIEAARAYSQAGDEKKAQEIYARVPQYGQGWYTGLAYYDQARRSIGSGQHAEARRLLQQPIDGKDADQVKVALLSLLSYSYYLTGDFEQAGKYGQEAIARYGVLRSPKEHVGLEPQVDRASNVVSWIRQWQKQPLICKPAQVFIQVNQLRGPLKLTRLITVLTPRRASIAAVSNQEQVVAHTSDEPARQGTFFWKQEVKLQIEGTLKQGVLQAIVSISSPDVPDFHVEVPVHVEGIGNELGQDMKARRD